MLNPLVILSEMSSTNAVERSGLISNTERPRSFDSVQLRSG